MSIQLTQLWVAPESQWFFQLKGLANDDWKAHFSPTAIFARRVNALVMWWDWKHHPSLFLSLFLPSFTPPFPLGATMDFWKGGVYGILHSFFTKQKEEDSAPLVTLLPFTLSSPGCTSLTTHTHTHAHKHSARFYLSKCKSIKTKG